MEGADLIVLVASAWAVSVEMGVSAGVLADLPDDAPAGNGHSSWFPAGDLRGNLEIGLGAASLRTTLAVNTGPGRDTVFFYDEGWQTSSDHWTWFAGAEALFGPSVRFPRDQSVQGTVSVQGGVMGFGAFHDFGGSTQVLLDPAQNDLNDPNNLDPYTIQAIPALDVSAGMRAGKRVALTIELGYTAGHVPAQNLGGAPPSAGARRTALALDALRLSVGVTVPLSRAQSRTSPETPP